MRAVILLAIVLCAAGAHVADAAGASSRQQAIARKQQRQHAEHIARVNAMRKQAMDKVTMKQKADAQRRAAQIAARKPAEPKYTGNVHNVASLASRFMSEHQHHTRKLNDRQRNVIQQLLQVIPTAVHVNAKNNAQTAKQDAARIVEALSAMTADRAKLNDYLASAMAEMQRKH